MEGKKVSDLFACGGSGGPAPAASSGPAPAAKVEEKKEEPKEEEEDVDMGGMFGDEDDFWFKKI